MAPSNTDPPCATHTPHIGEAVPAFVIRNWYENHSEIFSAIDIDTYNQNICKKWQN